MLTIGINSRALFNLDKSHRIYKDNGLDAYKDYQIKKERVPLKPGQAFSLVKKLLFLNKKKEDLVEVILLSRNTADTGLRIFNSIDFHNLSIKRAAFCGGQSPHIYAKSFGVDLFISTELYDCELAIKSGIASARMISNKIIKNRSSILKVAFDGDSVLFSNESQNIFDKKGLNEFNKNEKKLASIPLSGGPFKNFLKELHQIQKIFPKNKCPIKTALFTARCSPSHKRVIKTLRDWKIRIDECLFLGGSEKKEFLIDFCADIFFDDQIKNCRSASSDITTGHVISLKH